MQDKKIAPAAPKLLAFRKAHNLTQQKAAEALKCTGPAFNDWERGKKRPEPHFRQRIEAWTSGEIAQAEWLYPDEEFHVEPAAAAAVADESPTSGEAA